jgi:hypothetical protein
MPINVLSFDYIHLNRRRTGSTALPWAARRRLLERRSRTHAQPTGAAERVIVQE